MAAGDLLAGPRGGSRPHGPFLQGEVSCRVFWFDRTATFWVGRGQVVVGQVRCCYKDGVSNIEGWHLGKELVNLGVFEVKEPGLVVALSRSSHWAPQRVERLIFLTLFPLT